MNIYIDIETIPSQREDVKDVIASGVTHPATMSKAETIEKWEKDKRPAAVDAKLRETALGGTFGEIICISWAIDDGVVSSVDRLPATKESTLLSNFFNELQDQLDSVKYTNNPVWIGHNITGFDLRFIWQRCVINQVPPLIDIPYQSKPWDSNVFDTMVEWAGLQGKDKAMNKVCMALGLPDKGDMDGSKVYDAWLAGEYDKIREYCEGDVGRTRMMHKAMTFQHRGL